MTHWWQRLGTMFTAVTFAEAGEIETARAILQAEERRGRTGDSRAPVRGQREWWRAVPVGQRYVS